MEHGEIMTRILVFGTSKAGGGKERVMAYAKFLSSKGHAVDTIQFPAEDFFERAQYYYQRGRALLYGHEKRHMTKTADFLEKIIRRKRYEAVIGVETPFSLVLTRNLDCLKIFSCESIESIEYYYRYPRNTTRINNMKEMEFAILETSDYVLFPWDSTENFVRKYIYNGNNLTTVKFGCNPQPKTASFKYPPSIVSMGNIGYYWSNRELLAYLTKVSPYHIDLYGKYKPPRRYGLNYRGYAPSVDVLLNYQFGLNTVSKDKYRRNHFSSRPLSYLAFGLPVLSPDWMQLSHELKGCLPYNENNFTDLVEKYSERSLWEKTGKEAHEQAQELDWSVTLQPLEKIIAC
jgi:hypothetical protein